MFLSHAEMQQFVVCSFHRFTSTLNVRSVLCFLFSVKLSKWLVWWLRSPTPGLNNKYHSHVNITITILFGFHWRAAWNFKVSSTHVDTGPWFTAACCWGKYERQTSHAFKCADCECTVPQDKTKVLLTRQVVGAETQAKYQSDRLTHRHHHHMDTSGIKVFLV